MIYILEDNDDRVQQFLATASRIAPDVPVRVWRDAHAMIADLVDGLEHATVISLDHDLNRLPTEPRDPGSGYDVASLLGELIPCCRVIVHTSNAERGDFMVAELERAGWQYDRVYPFGDEWIANDWGKALAKCLGR